LFSFLSFSFLNPIIFGAYRARTHLPASEFPPLADYDQAVRLAARGAKQLDPLAGVRRGKSLFWGIIRIFRVPLFWQSALLVINAVAKIGTPIGTYRLLKYVPSLKTFVSKIQHIRPTATSITGMTRR
jgi:hypothetical protein